MGEPDYDRFADRLVCACRDDDRILAVLVYGSRATGTADAHALPRVIREIRV